MADWYVDSSSGNDSNSGTSGSPFLTIQKAMDSASAPDTIYLAGSFTLSSEVNFTSYGAGNNWSNNLKIYGWDNGQADNVTPAIGDRSSASIAGAVIDGNSAVARPFSHTSDPAHIKYKNIKFTGFTGNWAPNVAQYFYQCEFADNPSTSTLLTLSRALLMDTYFHGNTTSGSQAFSLSATQISNCVFEDIDDGRINLSGEGGVVLNTVVKGDNGILVYADGARLFIDKNSVIGEGSTSNAEGLWLANHSAVCVNNIIQNMDGTGSIALEATSGREHIVVGQNAFYDNTTDESTNLTNSALTHLSSENVAETSDPLTDAANGDYSLVSGANSRDAGLGLSE